MAGLHIHTYSKFFKQFTIEVNCHFLENEYDELSLSKELLYNINMDQFSVQNKKQLSETLI